jgi:non-ribosomal peptide synthetase component F
MSELSRPSANLPPEQAIRDKSFHPTGTFVEFPLEDVETSIPARFEKVVRLYPDRVAVVTNGHVVTYGQLNGAATRCPCHSKARREWQ